MRHVNHGTPPEFLRGMPNEFDRVFRDWDHMSAVESGACHDNPEHRTKIRDLKRTLKQRCGAVAGTRRGHGPICAYCEMETASQGPLAYTIDHFRPIKHDCARYNVLTFMWENLVYVCKRCNKIKGNKFPHAVGGYISPTDPRCHSYFAYNFDTLKVYVAHNICDDNLKDRINRTICDFKLNRQYLIDRRGAKKRDIDRELKEISAKGWSDELTHVEKRKKFKGFARGDKELCRFAHAYGIYKQVLTPED